MPAQDGWGFDSESGKWIGGGQSYDSVEDYRVAADAQYKKTGVRPGQICRGPGCGGGGTGGLDAQTGGGNTGGGGGLLSGGSNYTGGSYTGGAPATSQNVDKNSVGQYSPDLVENRITNMLGNDSDYLNMFRSNAQRQANARGLLNSSMAATAGERAAYEGAFPVASQDSQATNQFRLNEQAFDYNSALQNATEANKFGLLANEDYYTRGQNEQRTALEMKINDQLHAFDMELQNLNMSADDRKNLMEHYDQLSQQYMMQRSAILTDPNLDEDSKAKMVADLDAVYSDSIAMQSSLANFDTSVFSGGGADTSGFTNLTPEQQSALGGVNPAVIGVLDTNTELTDSEISALQGVDSSYISLLDTSRKYTASELAQLSGADPAYLDFINDDMVYTPEQLGQLSGLNPVFTNFLKDSNTYTPGELGQLQGVDTQILQYLKRPEEGYHYTPAQLGKLSGLDASVLQGQPLYKRDVGDVVSLYNSLAAKWDTTGVF